MAAIFYPLFRSAENISWNTVLGFFEEIAKVLINKYWNEFNGIW